MKYIRFRNVNEPNQLEITSLIERIQTELSSDKHSIPTSVAPVHHESSGEGIRPTSRAEEIHPRTTDLPPVSEWTSVDIRRWFKHEGIMDQIHDMFAFRSGKEMLDYAQMLLENQDKHQDIYSQIFAQKYKGQLLPPHEFIRFTNAMNQLLKDNSSEYLAKKRRSKTCVIL